MRIDPPFQPGSYPLDAAKTHIPELVSAANEFAFAIYQHSKLPIRVFEAARIATAVINGCTVCKSFRVATGVESLGVEGGVPDNGEATKQFCLATVVCLSSAKRWRLSTPTVWGKTRKA